MIINISVIIRVNVNKVRREIFVIVWGQKIV